MTWCSAACLQRSFGGGGGGGGEEVHDVVNLIMTKWKTFISIYCVCPIAMNAVTVTKCILLIRYIVCSHAPYLLLYTYT